MAYLPKPKQLTGFTTTDGAVFDNIISARSHQNDISMMLWLDDNRPISTAAEDIFDWLKSNRERLAEYFYCQDGSDPLYMEERP